MKVAVRTDEYTIYKKRSGRYAVRSSANQWINGDAKTAVLLQNKLIEAPKVKAPEPEPVVEAVAEAVAEAAAETGAAAE